ncbi:PadR family transcriptional regulator [Cryobacterium sp. N22]|uniref:PadR family transcriptional regulator n=1 Tax=Cryobacterium sp. N22 TaxID=2048290 RepID=UPI000CE54152|nr:PadR family transcriptional regulator [Cryobacterium sp. N22]
MANDVGTQLRKGVVEYCVLGLLQREPTYGWKISEQLVSLGLIGSIGTLYPLLGRLRDQGLIIAQADESDSARPRKYYSLTPAGREQLGQFRAQWQPFSDAVSSIIAVDASSSSQPTSPTTPPKGTKS